MSRSTRSTRRQPATRAVTSAATRAGFLLAASVTVLSTVVFAAGCDHAGKPGGAGTAGRGSTPAPTGAATSTRTPGGAPTTTAGRTPGSSPTGGSRTTGPTGTASPTGTRTSGPAPTTAAPTGLPAGLTGRDFTTIPTGRRIVALTFDAGANADGLPAILATLAREHVSATFFLTGRFAEAYPAQVRQIVAAGHRIGNHSVDHPYFTQLSDAQIKAQVSAAEVSIGRVAGTSPRPLFRFPYGDRNARTIAAVNAAGYVPVRWTVDTLGWKGTSQGVTAASVVERVLAGAQPGEIVLMHIGSNPDDHSTLDADALPTMIARLRSLGYNFVTLDALLP